MIAVWLAIIINFLLSLLILHRLSDALANAGSGPHPWDGPPAGTLLSATHDLPWNGDGQRVIVATSEECPGCQQVRQQLTKRGVADGIEMMVLPVDGYAEPELAEQGFAVVDKSMNRDVSSELGIDITPSFYVIDPDGRFLDGGVCAQAKWHALLG